MVKDKRKPGLSCLKKEIQCLEQKKFFLHNIVMKLEFQKHLFLDCLTVASIHLMSVWYFIYTCNILLHMYSRAPWETDKVD